MYCNRSESLLNTLKTVKSTAKIAKNGQKPCENSPKPRETSSDASISIEAVNAKQLDHRGHDLHHRWARF